MIYLWIFIAVYLLTLMVLFLIERDILKEDKAIVTINDVVKRMYPYGYIPIFNTLVLIIMCLIWLLWEILEKCRVIHIFIWLWNKIKDIEV